MVRDVTIKTVIVDDEPLALSLLSSILSDFPEISIVAQCENGSDAVDAIKTHDADLVFLDIEMPKMNGFDVIRRLQSDSFPLIIFTTAFSEYAVNAFEVNAIDYVLKPLDERRLAQSIEKVRQQLGYQARDLTDKSALLSVLEDISEKEREHTLAGGDHTETDVLEAGHDPLCLAIKDRGTVTLVLKADIYWFEAAGDYVCVHTRTKTYTMRATMKDIEAKLNSNLFSRVHRSTIVNHTLIREVLPLPKGEAYVRLENQEKIKVSRNYRDALRKIIGK